MPAYAIEKASRRSWRELSAIALVLALIGTGWASAEPSPWRQRGVLTRDDPPLVRAIERALEARPSP